MFDSFDVRGKRLGEQKEVIKSRVKADVSECKEKACKRNTASAYT